MNSSSSTPPQTSLLLRLLGGGYLMYLAWDLREAISDGPLFLLAVLMFGAVGAGLFGHSLWTLARHHYFRKTPSGETDSIEDLEESSDE